MKSMKLYTKRFFGGFIIFLSIGAFTTSVISGLLVLISGLFCFPSVMKEVEKRIKRKIPTKWKYVTVIGLFFLGVMLSGSTASTEQLDKPNIVSGEVASAEIKPVKKAEEPKKVVDPDADLLQSLVNVEEVLKDWDKLNAEYNKNYFGLNAWLVKKGKLIEQGKSSKNAEVVAKAKVVEKMLISYQVATFPRLRKEYIDALSALLWELNIDVVGGGVKNSTISFIGGTYASNKNKLETHNQIKEIMTLLRFKQDRYYWFKGSEYTYWDIDTMNDNEI